MAQKMLSVISNETKGGTKEGTKEGTKDDSV
jgi:hypothetical protein